MWFYFISAEIQKMKIFTAKIFPFQGNKCSIISYIDWPSIRRVVDEFIQTLVGGAPKFNMVPHASQVYIPDSPSPAIVGRIGFVMLRKRLPDPKMSYLGKREHEKWYTYMWFLVKIVIVLNLLILTFHYHHQLAGCRMDQAYLQYQTLSQTNLLPHLECLNWTIDQVKQSNQMLQTPPLEFAITYQ